MNSHIFNNRFSYGIVILSLFLSIPFAIYAVQLAWGGFLLGLSNAETLHIPLNDQGHPISNFGLSIHLALGAILTIFAPVQVILGWSRKYMKAHKWMGLLVIATAFITSAGGMVYILINGTNGGMVMDIAFFVYGALVFLTAWMSLKYARLKLWDIHENWSMRLFILAIGSWIYRMGYGLVFMNYPENMDIFGAVGPDSNFRGPYDIFMAFGFYVIPLIGLEIYLRNAKNRWHPFLITILLCIITIFLLYGGYGFLSIL